LLRRHLDQLRAARRLDYNYSRLGGTVPPDRTRRPRRTDSPTATSPSIKSKRSQLDVEGAAKPELQPLVQRLARDVSVRRACGPARRDAAILSKRQPDEGADCQIVRRRDVPAQLNVRELQPAEAAGAVPAAGAGSPAGSGAASCAKAVPESVARTPASANEVIFWIIAGIWPSHLSEVKFISTGAGSSWASRPNTPLGMGYSDWPCNQSNTQTHPPRGNSAGRIARPHTCEGCRRSGRRRIVRPPAPSNSCRSCIRPGEPRCPGNSGG
jgi:hypothetical protein